MPYPLNPHTQYGDYIGRSALDLGHLSMGEVIKSSGVDLPENSEVIGVEFQKTESNKDGSIRIYVLYVNVASFNTKNHEEMAVVMKNIERPVVHRMELPLNLSEALSKEGFIKRFGVVLLAKSFNDIDFEVTDESF
jgi:hypothetical protein